MLITGFIDILSELKEFEELCVLVENGELPLHVVGPGGAQKAHLVFALSRKLRRSAAIITSTDNEAKRLSEDLGFFTHENTVHIPEKELIFYNYEAAEHSIEHLKMRALKSIEESSTVVMSIAALLQFVMPKKTFDMYSRAIRVGDNVSITELAGALTEMGYKHVDTVEGRGQYAVRGGIIDIYSLIGDLPVRIEFFGDEVDSIREFSPLTQLSIEKIEEATLVPVSVPEETGSILEYIPKGWLIFADEPLKISDRANAIAWEVEENLKTLIEKGIDFQKKDRYINDYQQIVAEIVKRGVIGLSSLSGSCPDFRPKRILSFNTKSLKSYGGKIEFLYDDIKVWKNTRARVIILAGSKTRCANLIEALSHDNIEAVYYENYDKLTPKGIIAVTHGSISHGFEYPEINTVIVSDKEIFPSEKKKRKFKPDKNANKIKSYTELEVGDYVVHNVHGIGQYMGISRIEVDGVSKDYIKIRYRGDDYLYIPVSQLDMINKYTGAAEGRQIRLNKLGGSEWAKTKARVKESVAELVKKLVDLYAQRQVQKGHAFSPDTVWQREFESAFPYEETPDQLRCIEETKRDMESDKIMDRLLCGDVGFGKTEVAIRGAFKAVMDGMQVAYLVPTTILAVQHYNTFVERMKDYPIKIEMLSRFRTKKQQEEIVKQLKKGEIDIVIGTHRLLQKDVSFKNLGFLIIDEEQRFGVMHKERIKELKKNVDVLTLTATPIPRTLHMAMIGIRDISLLTQPPQERYPVQTFVLEYNKEVILNAIARELARGGQVFYLYNRIQGIHRIAEELKASLPPDTVVEVAHGRMNEVQLENILMRFLEGEIDVLVCTTIIETGLDIPNVNTIIIENSDKLGLAQLYQLRGRVGRSSRLAYAYLTYRKDKILDEVAEKRLKAIKEFTEFGSGFKIALRDLEIRGAGNVLGPEQHGFMETVGYDMYCKLLEEAIREAKGEAPPPEKEEVLIDVNVNAYIPEEYIKNPNTRIEIYKKIAGIEDLSDSYAVEEELEDRFGDPPESVRRLIEIALLRNEASLAGITEITQNGSNIILKLSRQRMPSLNQISELIGAFKGKILFSAGEKPYLSYMSTAKSDDELIENIKNILKCLQNAEK